VIARLAGNPQPSLARRYICRSSCKVIIAFMRFEPKLEFVGKF
jgi:hypothetical protein